MDNYMDAPVISRREAREMVANAVITTLEELDLISPYIERTKIVEMIGRADYERGVALGLMNPIKRGGKTSKILVLRSEVEEYRRTIILNGDGKPLIIKR